MKLSAGWAVLLILVFIAVIALGTMIKYATEIQVEEHVRRDYLKPMVIRYSMNSMDIITIKEGMNSLLVLERYPYLCAITYNSSAVAATLNVSTTWLFACFGSVFRPSWVLTAAHCRKGFSSHRILTYHNFGRNKSTTSLVLEWYLHQDYSPKKPEFYDIAVAKIELIGVLSNPATMKFSTIPYHATKGGISTSVWKTVSTMDKRLFLTNDCEDYTKNKITVPAQCEKMFGITLDESLICVDLSAYDDCFIFEFGPIYKDNHIIGVLSTKPTSCDIKLAIFSNVSYYSTWIYKMID